MKKKHIYTLFTMLIAVAVVAGSTITANAAAKKYDLPSKVQAYYLPTDEDDNIISDEWKASYSETFTYNNKGLLVAYKKTDKNYNTGKKEITSETTKWTYRKGKIAKRVTKSTYSTSSITDTRTFVGTFDKKGRLLKETEKRKGDKDSTVCSYSHNKKGWIYKRTSRVGNENAVVNVKTKYYKNGMPKSMNINAPGFGMMSGYRMLFKFNKKGLITKETYRYASDGETYDDNTYYTYDYDSKGRVKTIYIKSRGNNDKYQIVRKLEYTYGKSKTTDKRAYFGIMNHTYACIIASHDVTPGPYYFMR